MSRGAGSEAVAPAREAPAGSAAVGTRTVLLVDDDASVLGMLERVLQKAGIPAETASSLEDASARLEVGPYAAVISDVRLGGLESGGLEVLTRVKRDHPGTPVILLTGFGSPVLMERAHQMGADCYYEKPVCVNTLIEALREALP